jgi:capsular polysaccharide biosynthesis protein
MSARDQGPGAEAEREIDLRALSRGVLHLWWVVAIAVVVGAIVGALYSVGGGGSLYEASARIAPGQAFNPSGSSAVLTYLTNQAAINEIATSETTLEEAASEAGMPIEKLRGNVTTSSVSANTSSGSAASTGRNAVLVDITVQSNNKRHAEDAANAIARIVQRKTTSRYVLGSIGIYAKRIRSFQLRLGSIQKRIDVINQALSSEKNMSLNNRLLLTISLDQAQATQGQTIDALSTAQQEQILAQDVERTQLIDSATAAKTSARSPKSSVVIGAIIGFLIGVGIAIFMYYRGPRAATG